MINDLAETVTVPLPLLEHLISITSPMLIPLTTPCVDKLELAPLPGGAFSLFVLVTITPLRYIAYLAVEKAEAVNVALNSTNARVMGSLIVYVIDVTVVGVPVEFVYVVFVLISVSKELKPLPDVDWNDAYHCVVVAA